MQGRLKGELLVEELLKAFNTASASFHTRNNLHPQDILFKSTSALNLPHTKPTSQTIDHGNKNEELV
jgi:hypothetical protein